MIDREKAIKGLTEIYDEAYDRWVHRPYIEDKLVTLIRDCIPDALTLLREQETVEPRVLTLEEVMKLRHRDEIWIEYGGAHSKLFMLTIARRRRWGFTFYRHFPCYWDNYGGKNNTNHDWWWRCWSNRPTAQQREAVKWDAND